MLSEKKKRRSRATCLVLSNSPTIPCQCWFTGDFGWESNAFWYMGIPGLILFIVQQIIAFMGRATLGLDMIEEASPGKDMGGSASASLTNNAVVAALLLTVAIAMTQADPPQETSTRLLSQWYLYFSTTSSIFCLQSTLRSVLLMIYVEPLDAQVKRTAGTTGPQRCRC